MVMNAASAPAVDSVDVTAIAILALPKLPPERVRLPCYQVLPLQHSAAVANAPS